MGSGHLVTGKHYTIPDSRADSSLFDLLPNPWSGGLHARWRRPGCRRLDRPALGDVEARSSKRGVSDAALEAWHSPQHTRLQRPRRRCQCNSPSCARTGIRIDRGGNRLRERPAAVLASKPRAKGQASKHAFPYSVGQFLVGPDAFGHGTTAVGTSAGRFADRTGRRPVGQMTGSRGRAQGTRRTRSSTRLATGSVSRRVREGRS